MLLKRSPCLHGWRFIVFLTDQQNGIPKELGCTMSLYRSNRSFKGSNLYSMFKDYWKYSWVLKEHRYEQLRQLARVPNKN